MVDEALLKLFDFRIVLVVTVRCGHFQRTLTIATIGISFSFQFMIPCKSQIAYKFHGLLSLLSLNEIFSILFLALVVSKSFMCESNQLLMAALCVMTCNALAEHEPGKL